MIKLMFVIANEPHRPVTEVHPGLPRLLDAIDDKAPARNPETRFSDSAAMAGALRDSAARAA